MDRYSKIVLTVIAAALVYLCIVMTAFPAVSAQQTALRPGEMTGPVQAVIVGWRAPEMIPVAVQRPVTIAPGEPLRIVGNVTTERTNGPADRVILAGWEYGATRDKAGQGQPFTDKTPGLPVAIKPPQ